MSTYKQHQQPQDTGEKKTFTDEHKIQGISNKMYPEEMTYFIFFPGQFYCARVYNSTRYRQHQT